jgi:pimeloyl-ACP methyl ester carboxylesterase
MIKQPFSGFGFIFGVFPAPKYFVVTIVIGVLLFKNNKTDISGNSMQIIRSKDGAIIASQRSGSGPPLVLVHGGTADHTRWNPVIPELEKKFTVYAVDRRGRGGSTDSGPYAIEREFEDIAAVADAIGEPVYLLGHSFGAFCSLEASLLTSNIAKLILYEPPPPGIKGTMPAHIVAKMQDLLDTGDRDGVVSTFMLEVAKIPENELNILKSLPSWDGRVVAAHTILREIKALEELPAFQPDRFAAMDTSTLLLLGGESPSAYSDFIRLINASLPNSRIAVMPGQKHVAMNTAPELFTAEVIGFLTDEE